MSFLDFLPTSNHVQLCVVLELLCKRGCILLQQPVDTSGCNGKISQNAQTLLGFDLSFFCTGIYTCSTAVIVLLQSHLTGVGPKPAETPETILLPLQLHIELA